MHHTQPHPAVPNIKAKLALASRLSDITFAPGADGALEVSVRGTLSEAVTLLPAARLELRPEITYMSRRDMNKKQPPCYAQVRPVNRQADWHRDSILPILRPKVQAPSHRPWTYYTIVEGYPVRVNVYGLQDMVSLRDHVFSCWNGVYLRRLRADAPPTVFGVLSVDKDAWSTYTDDLKLTNEQRQIFTAGAMLPLSHAWRFDEQELFEAINSVEDGTPVSLEDIEAIGDYCDHELRDMLPEAVEYRQERCNAQIQEALHGLQAAITTHGIQSPLTAWGVEQWLYPWMSHPHRLTVGVSVDESYGWEGPGAPQPSQTRHIAKVEVETAGHLSFVSGVRLAISLPAMTDKGLNFLTNNLHQYMPEIEYAEDRRRFAA